MGEARKRRKAMEAAGLVAPVRPARRQVTWSFVVNNERFERVHADARRIFNAPESEQDFAQGLLEQGLQMVEAMVVERERAGRLVVTPDEADEISARLQAAREGRI